ncbi:hypothetical protein IQ06DRAFT_290902 [Phaeosphaeriaceae sp. SRC1lsM3a]|nr:hypothetical protein IQ06DRAFT_290902 [Stagonospora sp. SRC1lsM3a]
MRMPPHGRNLAASQALKIRIPKAIWNAYETPTKRITRSSVSTLSCSFPSASHTTDPQDIAANTQPNTSAVNFEEPTTKRIRRTDCKVKLWIFHYGGSRRVMKGKVTNQIEYDTPCLQRTCKTCMIWHPHLLYEQDPAGESSRQQSYHKPAIDIEPIKPDIEPISPDIDPRILDGTWQIYQSRRGSATSTRSLVQPTIITTPELTPVKPLFTGNLQPLDISVGPHPALNDIPLASGCTVCLPVSLVTQAVATTSSRSRWRTIPREQYMVRVIFLSREGRRKFVDLVRKREMKLKRRLYDRERRAKRAARKQAGMRGA